MFLGFVSAKRMQWNYFATFLYPIPAPSVHCTILFSSRTILLLLSLLCLKSYVSLHYFQALYYASRLFFTY